MTSNDDAETITAEEARGWWRALMENACALIEDADVLAENESYGRARSLVVLGMEELSKALRLYLMARSEWSKPLGLYGRSPEPAGPVQVPDLLGTTRRPHAEKLKIAEQFASGLDGFWDPSRRDEYYFPDDIAAFESSAKQRNLDKQAGFYVDRVSGIISSPLSVEGDEVRALIRHAAEVLEMHLIEDHTRQQNSPDPKRIDSSQGLHWQILPIAHPEEVAAFIGEVGED